MKKMVYIGPSLHVVFMGKVGNRDENRYRASIQTKTVTFLVDIVFIEKTEIKAETGTEPPKVVEVAMGIVILQIPGDGKAIGDVQQGLSMIQQNHNLVCEVCCGAYLNGFLNIE